MVLTFSNNLQLMSFFSIIIVSVILITSQTPAAFAGAIGGPEDPDGDGIFSSDNCPNVYNPNQEDVNDDGIGDACVPPSQLVEEVIDVIEETLEDVSDLTPGQINSIVTKLENAADQLDSNKINGATGSLNAFINQMEAFINNGQVPAEEGQAIIDAIQSIIDAIND